MHYNKEAVSKLADLVSSQIILMLIGTLILIITDLFQDTGNFETAS